MNGCIDKVATSYPSPPCTLCGGNVKHPMNEYPPAPQGAMHRTHQPHQDQIAMNLVSGSPNLFGRPSTLGAAASGSLGIIVFFFSGPCTPSMLSTYHAPGLALQGQVGTGRGVGACVGLRHHGFPLFISTGSSSGTGSRSSYSSFRSVRAPQAWRRPVRTRSGGIGNHRARQITVTEQGSSGGPSERQSCLTEDPASFDL